MESDCEARMPTASSSTSGLQRGPSGAPGPPGVQRPPAPPPEAHPEPFAAAVPLGAQVSAEGDVEDEAHVPEVALAHRAMPDAAPGSHPAETHAIAIVICGMLCMLLRARARHTFTSSTLGSVTRARLGSKGREAAPVTLVS